MENNSCPYKPRKVLTEKQAKKEKVGSFYHPTEKTFRTGACPIGYTERKPHTRKSYTKKDGKKIQETEVNLTCVKDTGLPGKILKEFKVITINQKNNFKPYGYKTTDNSNVRHKSLLEAAKQLSYGTVIRKLSALRTLHKNYTDKEDIHFKYYTLFDKDIKKLQEWREKNPDLYKTKTNV
jgi:hypothetical protein